MYVRFFVYRFSNFLQNGLSPFTEGLNAPYMRNVSTGSKPLHNRLHVHGSPKRFLNIPGRLSGIYGGVLEQRKSERLRKGQGKTEGQG
jgi:hypothetical protein